MGLPLQEFHDGPDIEWIRDQLNLESRTGIREEQTSSDVETRYEEDQEKKGPWDGERKENLEDSEEKKKIPTYPRKNMTFMCGRRKGPMLT
jgi:hypothetical protein